MLTAAIFNFAACPASLLLLWRLLPE